jgi:hypothetical protein
MSKLNRFCRIKVTNLDTKVVFFHNKVPYEHVEMLKLSPNLEIDILGHYREGGDESREASQEDYNGVIF